MEDFPVHLPNPFSEEFCNSDLVLIVEGKELHTHKQLISLYCAYFRVLLNSEGFAEAGTQNIELKDDQFVDVKYDTMVTFLRYLYPVHSSECIKDDTTLENILPIAEYFQCQHVRAKCEAYLQQKMFLLGLWSPDSRKISAQSACLYLWLCEKYGIKKFVENLLKVICQKELSEINNKYYESLSLEMQSDVHLRRAKFLEGRINYQRQSLASGIFLNLYQCEMRCGKCGEKAKRKHIICCDCGIEYKRGFQHSF